MISLRSATKVRRQLTIHGVGKSYGVMRTVYVVRDLSGFVRKTL